LTEVQYTNFIKTIIVKGLHPKKL